MSKSSNQIQISLLDNINSEEKQMVYGVVAFSNLISSAGHFFTKKDLVDLSMSFMKNVQQGKAFFDTHHDRKPIDAYIVESFITESKDKNNSQFPSDAWVIGIKVDDSGTWEQVKSKDINSFSATFEADLTQEVVEYEVPTVIAGVTETEGDHSHTYVLVLDDNGNILSGKTNEVDGHYHDVYYIGSTGEGSGHAHRFYTSY